MASLDSANGPSATTRPFLPETTLPSRSSGFPAMAFPCAVNRSNQPFHWLTTFCVSSGDRPLCQSLPRNSSMYSDFVVCAFIIFFLLMVDCFRSVNITTNDPRHLGHRTQSFSSTEFGPAVPLRWRTSRSVWSASSLLALSGHPPRPKAGASSTHSTRFATFGCGIVAPGIFNGFAACQGVNQILERDTCRQE